MMESLDPSFGRDVGPGPWAWLVLWGALGRPGARTTTVMAFEASEALTLAAEKHPEWEAPRVAVLARQAPGPGPVR